MHLKAFRKAWNLEQKRLRALLVRKSDLQDALQIFFQQHQPLHNLTTSNTGDWSYAEEIFSDLTLQDFRKIPAGENHSLLWILWHISRIEDVTMSVLVAGKDQAYMSGGWKEKIGSPIHHTGNAAGTGDLAALNQQVNPEALLAYREAVGRNTRAIVSSLGWEELSEKVDPERLDRLVDEGAVLPEAEDLLTYWGKRTHYELLLMPPTRHLMVHLNEAWSIKMNLGKGKTSA